jgi:undecaprenyl-diphosphatase
VSTSVATLSPAPPAEPKKRSTLGRLLTIGFTFLAINGLLGQIGSFRDIGAALGRANWGWVIVAALCVAVTFPVSAIGARAGLGATAPLGAVTALQLASRFASLVTPAGLGSTALNVRFMKRQGVDATSAITSDVASGVVSGAAEVALAGICLLAARRRLDIGGLPAGTGKAVLIAVLVIALVVAIVSRIPKLRNAVMPHVRKAWATIVALVRSPRRTALIAFSAAVVAALFAVCLGLSLRAYGHEVPFATLFVVNWGAATLGSVSPVPGGLGVAEAGLVAGLAAAGVPTDIAVAAALTHRLVTFWLPPVAGWIALRRLEREELL